MGLPICTSLPITMLGHPPYARACPFIGCPHHLLLKLTHDELGTSLLLIGYLHQRKLPSDVGGRDGHSLSQDGLHTLCPNWLAYSPACGRICNWACDAMQVQCAGPSDEAADEFVEALTTRRDGLPALVNRSACSHAISYNHYRTRSPVGLHFWLSSSFQPTERWPFFPTFPLR